MDLYEFNQLCLAERAQYTWENGTFIKAINADNKTFGLYYTKRFFIELEYVPFENIISRIRAFKSETPLQRYLNDIDLLQLINE